MRSTICDRIGKIKRNTSVTPYAFTEQGVAMLSGILNSETAINMNIAIMRAFYSDKKVKLTADGFKRAATRNKRKAGRA